MEGTRVEAPPELEDLGLADRVLARAARAPDLDLLEAELRHPAPVARRTRSRADPTRARTPARRPRAGAGRRSACAGPRRSRRAAGAGRARRPRTHTRWRSRPAASAPRP